MRSKRKKYKITFVPDAIAWTEVPSTIKSLSRQRNRWHRGLCELISIHRDIIFNPRFGFLGVVTLPYYVVFELFGPAIELIGYFSLIISYLLGIISSSLLILVFSVAVVFHFLFSVLSIVLERVTLNNYPKKRDFFQLLLFSFFENFGYRQLTVIWRVKGIIDYLKGKKDWGVIKREGFQAQERAEEKSILEKPAQSFEKKPNLSK